MLADLTEKQKPNIRLDDVLATRRRRPRRVHRATKCIALGQLLGLSVPATESYWLADRLAKGTEKLGGNDPAKRLLAGRMLLAGGFKDLARTYLPTLEQAQKIADEGLRNEITNFLSTQQESEAAQRGQVQRIWDENVRMLTDPNAKVNEWEKLKAAQAIAKVIAQMPPTTLGAGLHRAGEEQSRRRRALDQRASGRRCRRSGTVRPCRAHRQSQGPGDLATLLRRPCRPQRRSPGTSSST